MESKAKNDSPLKSITGKLTHIRHNTFTYGQCVVTKYLGGTCVATVGSALSFEANSERELINRINAAGYGQDN